MEVGIHDIASTKGIVIPIQYMTMDQKDGQPDASADGIFVPGK